MDCLSILCCMLGIGYRPNYYCKGSIWEGVDWSTVTMCLTDRKPISIAKQPGWIYSCGLRIGISEYQKNISLCGVAIITNEEKEERKKIEPMKRYVSGKYWDRCRL